MILVVDMNVIFSFFKKHSITRKLIISSDIKLYTPEYALDELNRHAREIIRKSRLSFGAFEMLKVALLCHVNFVPVCEYKQFKTDAEAISPDMNDTQYFALALKLRCPIWSNDKGLKKQDKVKVLSTGNFIKTNNGQKDIALACK